MTQSIVHIIRWGMSISPPALWLSFINVNKPVPNGGRMRTHTCAHKQFLSCTFDDKSYSFIAIPDDYRDERSSMSYARSLCDFTTSSCPLTVNQSMSHSVSVRQTTLQAAMMVVPVALQANKDIIQLEVQIPARLVADYSTDPSRDRSWLSLNQCIAGATTDCNCRIGSHLIAVQLDR